MIDRMMRASRLEVGLYEEVEHDLDATTQAFQVVVVVAVATGLGAGLGALFGGSVGGAVGALILGVIVSVVGWLVWSYVTFWIGTTLFGGTATYGELLRTIGFASSPGVLRVLSFIPVLGSLLSLAVAIWTLIAGVIAVRQALDFDTGKAIATVVIGWVIAVILTGVVGLVAGGMFFSAG